jgi:hypothetical protein
VQGLAPSQCFLASLSRNTAPPTVCLYRWP